MALSKKVWLGVATEATSGTAIATPTVFTPTKAGFKNMKKRVYLSEERGTRDVNNAVVDSVRHAEGTFNGSWYNDTSPYFLYAFMGVDTPSTPSAGVYLHALTLGDIPPSLTLFRAIDNVATYQLPYSVVDKLKFSFAADGKVLEMSGGWQGMWGLKMGSPPSRPADTTMLPFAGYAPTIQFGGVTSNDIEELDIELEQKIELWFACNGTQDLVKIYFGERTAKLSLTARFDADTFYEKYHASAPTDDHVNVAFTGPVISSTYHQEVIFDFPIVGWDEMDHENAKPLVQVKAKGTARPGTAINSLFSATVQNAVTVYTL